MTQFQLLETTNYLSPNVFYNKFLFWLVRLQPFVNQTGNPPMKADEFVRLFRLLYGSGLRVSEALNLKKKDLDLNHRLLTISKAKTGYNQRTTILPYDIPILEKQTENLSKDDYLFKANRHIVWQYGKDAGNLAGLNIGEIQGKKTIDGVWNHLMRKSCSKRMRDLGASRELAMVKLRHVNVGSHDTYDRPDLNAVLIFEDKHFGGAV
ncbi:MAG TPA: site-specific integrase [Nitrosarchaeum sp.]|nr:site-specific integrase [Nitrosarchaeum sp.]